MENKLRISCCLLILAKLCCSVELHVPISIVEEGDNLNLTCISLTLTTVNLNNLKVTWWKTSGEPFVVREKGNRFRIKQHNNNVLMLTKITRNESGLYECEANLLRGIIKRNEFVMVQYAPNIRIQNSLSQVLMPADEAILQCDIEAFAYPDRTTYNWLKGDKSRIENGHKYTAVIYRPTYQRTILKLIIHDVEWSDEQNYTCVAINEYGKAESTIKLVTMKRFDIF